MVNCILFCALLAAIGACYVWLGVKKMNRADQIRVVNLEIEDLKKQIKEKDNLIQRRLNPEDLRANALRHGLELKPIEIGPRGHLYKLPEPSASVPEADPETPALAGTL